MSGIGGAIAQQAMRVSESSAAAYSKLSADQAMTTGMDSAVLAPPPIDIDQLGAARYYRLSADQGYGARLLDDGVLPAFAPEGIAPVKRPGSRKRRFAAEAVASKTPGDGILNSMQAVRDQFMEIEHCIKSLISRKQDFSTADLMKLQYHVMQLTYINELSSKTADKTSQAAQTLFRNQG
jgi:hypothetical protein